MTRQAQMKYKLHKCVNLRAKLATKLKNWLRGQKKKGGERKRKTGDFPQVYFCARHPFVMRQFLWVCWISMIFRGSPSFSMIFHGFSWFSVVFHGFPWISMEIHGFPWISMDFDGNPWISMDFHGFSSKSMEIHEKPWNFMKNHGNPWFSMENLCWFWSDFWHFLRNFSHF